MIKELKSISRQMVVYGLGGFLTRAVGFLLLPFYTYYILPEEYGVMALVDLTGYILGVFITVQLSSGFMKSYYDCKSEEDKNRLIASTYLLVLLTGIIVLGILEVYAPEVCSLIVGGTEHTLLFRLVFITIFLDSLYSIFQSYIRAKERPTLFVVLQVTKTLLSLILNVYFIAFLKLSILGIFLTNTIVAALFVIPCSFWMIRRSGLKTSRYYVKELFWFGVPLIPTGLFELTFHFSDRFFLKAYSTLEVLGVYAVSHKFSMILGVVIIYPFQLMWSAKLFDLSKKENGKEVQGKVLTYLFFALFFLFLSISVPISEFVYILLSDKYHDAYQIIPIVLLGSLFFGLQGVFKSGLLIRKKTGLISIVACITAVINILLNFILVKAFAAMGAAVSLMISYFTYSLLMYAVSQKYYPVNYEFKRLFKIVVAGAIVFITSRLIPEATVVISLVIKTALVLTFPVLLYLLNFYDIKERNYIYRVIYEART